MTAGQLIRDTATNFPQIFDKDFLHIFQPTTLYRMIKQAEREVMIDTKLPEKRRKVTATVDERGINLEDDFLLPITVRVLEVGDDVDFEGYPIELVDLSELDKCDDY